MVIDVAFWALAAGAVVAGYRVFRTDSMVRASFLLLLSFLAVGGIALLLAAPYLGAAILFMMAVEMTVMALFMVMFMMNPAGLNPMQMVHQPRVAAAAGIVGGGGLAVVGLLASLPGASVGPTSEAVVVALGHELLGDSMLVFESAGVAIVATMIGAVILSGHRGRFGDAHEGSVPPSLALDGPPAGRQPEEDGEG